MAQLKPTMQLKWVFEDVPNEVYRIDGEALVSFKKEKVLKQKWVSVFGTAEFEWRSVEIEK